jgi:hypothetical protein
MAPTDKSRTKQAEEAAKNKRRDPSFRRRSTQELAPQAQTEMMETATQ